jgi:hypothetical protein
VGRSWLLQTKADALTRKGKTAEARHALDAALEAAHNIPNQGTREHTVERIKKKLERSTSTGAR